MTPSDRNRNRDDVPRRPEPEPWTHLREEGQRSGARRYRAELRQGGVVVAGGRNEAYAMVLNFTPGRWAEDARIQLDQALLSMLVQAKIPESRQRECFLQVLDWEMEQPEFRWTLTWDPTAREHR